MRRVLSGLIEHATAAGHLKSLQKCTCELRKIVSEHRGGLLVLINFYCTSK